MATPWKEGELLYQLFYERTWRIKHHYKPYAPSITVNDCIQVEEEVKKELDEWYKKANATKFVSLCLEKLEKREEALAT